MTFVCTPIEIFILEIIVIFIYNFSLFSLSNVRNVLKRIVYKCCVDRISFSFLFFLIFFLHFFLGIYIKLFYSLFYYSRLWQVWLCKWTILTNDSNLIINIYFSSAKIIDIIRTDFNRNIYSIKSILIRIAHWFNSLRFIISYLSYSSIYIYISYSAVKIAYFNNPFPFIISNLYIYLIYLNR